VANNYSFKDATAATLTAKSTDTGSVHTPHVNVDTLPALSAGTNNIGDVDILSIASGDNNIGNVDIASIAAGDNNIGNVDIVTMPTVTVNSHAVTNAGTFAVQNTAATPAGTNNIGDVDVLTVNGVAPAFGTGVRGATVQRVTIATDDSVPVTIATVPSHAVTNAGTFATQVDGNALTALQLIDDPVFADDAAVTLGTSKGGLMAGVAVQTDGTDPTTVSAEGDAAVPRTDMQRLLLVNQTHPRGATISADYASAQTNVSVISAPGASLSIYITDISLSNGATAGNVTLLDGSGGTVKWEVYPAINGGAVLSGLRQPIKLTANTALCLTSSTVTTHSIFIGYYIAP